MDFEDVVIPLEPVRTPLTHELIIEVETPLVPNDLNLESDTRPLGIAVRSIRVE